MVLEFKIAVTIGKKVKNCDFKEASELIRRAGLGVGQSSSYDTSIPRLGQLTNSFVICVLFCGTCQ